MSDTNIFNEVPELNYSEEREITNGSEFEKVINARRSIRKYKEDKIPEHIVEKCLEIALKAPNSSNLQQWQFYWIKTPQIKKQIAEACFSQPAATTAAELIVCVARTDTWKKHAKQMLEVFKTQSIAVPDSAIKYYEKLCPVVYNQGPLGVYGLFKWITFNITGLFRPMVREPVSKADMRVWAHKSTALACENLMLAFSAYGYDTCPMEGYDSKRVKNILNLPSCAEICMIVSAGVRDPKGVYGPRIRFPKEQFIFKI
ncbi:MAG: nitroreductase family protein [Bdellovibrio sp.]